MVKFAVCLPLVLISHGPRETWSLWFGAPEELLVDVGEIFGTGITGTCSLCRVKVSMKLVPGSSKTSCPPLCLQHISYRMREGSCVDWLKVMAVTPGCPMARVLCNEMHFRFAVLGAEGMFLGFV